MTKNAALPWYRRVHRFGQTNLTEDDPACDHLDFWKEQWKRTGIQGLIINCGGIVAYYPSAFGLQYRAAGLGNQDYFKKWSDAAREAGLAVVARMDINRATEEFYQAHPDWFAIDREGKPYTSQGRYFSCVNGPYYKEYIPAVLTEIVERYHPDGFADNSWMGLRVKQICYCENCRKKFREAYGLELPEAVDFDDPVFVRWMKWSLQCRTENWDLFNETVKKAGGPDCEWCGMINADPAGEDGAFADKKALLSRSRIVFTDHQNRDRLNGAAQNMDNGLLLHMASSADLVILESMANYVRGNHTFRLSANPAEETHIWMYSGAAGGLSPWYHHIGGGLRDRRQFDTPVPFMRWHAENEAYLYDRETAANVAVVWSQDNSFFYGKDKVRERVAFPYRGVLAALHEGRIPFFPVHIDDIDRYRDRIDTLILPDIEVMTDAQEESILRWIRDGKALILSGKPGFRNEYGEEKGRSRILEALGLTLTGESGGALETQPADWEHPYAHSYLEIRKTENAEGLTERYGAAETAVCEKVAHETAADAPESILLRGFEDTDILPFGGQVLGMKNTGPLVSFGSYILPFPIFPPEFSWIRKINEGLPPFFAGVLSSGSRIVYLAADVDRTAGRDRLPDHLRLLLNAVLYTLDGKLPLTVEGEGYIDVSLYRQGDAQRVIHLNNLSIADMTTLVHRRVPVRDITLRLPAEGHEKAAVLLRRSGREFTVTAENGCFVIPIPKIGDFELTVVRFGP